MDLGLAGKVAVVTGASAGIGKASAAALTAEGASVVLNAREGEALEATARELSRAGARVVPVASDLTTAEGVNNVGGPGRFAPFMELGDDEWVEVLNLNLLSAVRTTRAFLPAMQRQRWGRIINIASESGVQPDPEKPHYNASKAALLNLTKSLSKAFAADGILVNAVSPAFVMTPAVHGMIEKASREAGRGFDEEVAAFLAKKRPHIEVKRPGEPQEVAAVVAFLASERASFINGANFRVDGGSVASI
jgi:3-oxoacyl-[acyl-carrier protein] reductase